MYLVLNRVLEKRSLRLCLSFISLSLSMECLALDGALHAGLGEKVDYAGLRYPRTGRCRPRETQSCYLPYATSIFLVFGSIGISRVWPRPWISLKLVELAIVADNVKCWLSTVFLN